MPGVPQVQVGYSLALALTFPIMLYPVIHILEDHLLPFSSHTHPSMKWKKNLLRATLVVIVAFFSWLGHDTLDNFVALVGGFCSVPLAFIYPVLMHAKLTQGTLSFTHVVLDVTVGCIGIAIFLFASAFAILTWP